MDSKTTELNYYVVNGYNPRTGEALLRPMLTGLKTYDSAMIADYAVANGYIPSGTKKESAIAVYNGMMAGAKALAELGFRVDLASWISLRPVLLGSLDETLRVTGANRLKTMVGALKDLRLDKENFSFVLVGDSGARPKVDFVISDVAGAARGLLKRGETFAVNGTNLAMGSGDTATLSWKEGEAGAERTLALGAPASVGEYVLKFEWPEGGALDALPSDTVVTITLKIADPDSGAVKSASARFKIVA